MPVILDPDHIALTTDIVVDTTNRTIEIKTTGAVQNAGSTGGVAGQALYSFLKEKWKESATFIKFPFPMEAITPEQFEFINGWKPANDTTRKLIRNAGWAERTVAGAVTRKYMGVVTLGSLGATDQPYFRWNADAKTNFTYAGPTNEAIQIFGDATNGDFDYADGGDTLTLFVREQGKTYASSNNSAIGAAVLTYQVYRFPLSNAADLKVTATDAVVSTTAPYNQITVEYFGSDQSRNIDGTPSPFRVIVTDASGTATTGQIYTKLQYLLRQASDIDSGPGVVTGATADALAAFVGDTLVGATSVAIDNLNSNFLNAVELFDKNGVKRLYPFVAAGVINFGSQAGAGDFIYRVYFKTNPAGDFGTENAVLVQDKDGTPISGTYNGSPIAFSFAYDTNAQGGRSAGTNATVTVVGIGLTGGQYVAVDHTIARSQGQSVLLAPAQERNYANPA
jgi:hypothetical protein